VTVIDDRPGAAAQPPAENLFVACTLAVNGVLGRGSSRHEGRPCPGRWARDDAGRTVLAYCERGCFDDAATLLEDVLARVTSREVRQREGTLDAYAARTAGAALGQLHRERRKRLGLPQRPERVRDADWAERILPEERDRLLPAHMLTWLGSDAPAAGDAGWPIDGWAQRYGLPEAVMRAWVGRVASAVREGDPRRFVRYLAVPLAAKARMPALFDEVSVFDEIYAAA